MSGLNFGYWLQTQPQTMVFDATEAAEQQILIALSLTEFRLKTALAELDGAK